MNTNIPVITIVGRPNVGKSSLFNRIFTKRKAIIEERSGTTRDRLHVLITRFGTTFELVDTAGMDFDDNSKIKRGIIKQTEDAVGISDLLLMVVDVKNGILPLDLEIAATIRKTAKRTLLLVNKVDNQEYESQINDFYRLGLGEPYPISALHNKGIESLLEHVVELFGPLEQNIGSDVAHSIKLSIVGKPNVGKSSFVNAITNEERVIVSDVPGTTRDAIDTHFVRDDIHYKIVDTAGLRHKKKVTEVVEVFSQARSKESIRNADVVIFIIDAVQGITRDDISIVNYVITHGKGILFVINKWDLVKEITQEEYEKKLRQSVVYFKWIPMIFSSCLTGRNVLKVIDKAYNVYKRLTTTFPTSELNKVVHRVEKSKNKFYFRHRQIRVLYIVQKSYHPVSFIVFANIKVIERYFKYLENILRKFFPLDGVPIKFESRWEGNNKSKYLLPVDDQQKTEEL